ncbi:asparagine synthetase B [Luteitalea sp. TBR-22]|uniref:asparagine synthase (glutamine-hydrolyzing) n=1 Tax=Luteitalea sp. TBR-22 TaxID=2802971 RepID=UPI001AFB6605|nr:asparagine synthase (glutamine-hydrolyzing) [Luteitalea sp. TBR-22]BCS34692.1 asparagine synthetase B [Luteitalea sp. TBR-22]
MCGIAGRINFRSGAPVDPTHVTAMCDFLRHRGPDGEGVWSDGPVAFGHRRLSIIDLSSAGAQPMCTADRRLWLTFNGEIYNFQDVRRTLEGKGYTFRSHSDSEVILAAYDAYGDDCVQHFVGMFAFAIWDTRRRRALLARDRVGKKPLFYRFDADGMAFASEVRAFFGEPGFRAEPDPQAIADYLGLQYVPTPGSAFKGVHKLPPGHVMTIEDGASRITSYWSLQYQPKLSLTEDEAVEAVEEALDRAVRDRLVSDVPLGAFLSGGIDSGTVVALMARHSSGPVRTFSIGFTEERYNELPAARLVAERYGTSHEEFVVEPDAIALMPKLVWHYGEPYADSSALPSFILAEMTRRHVTVALNGDGGDESFAGYTRYVASLAAARIDGVLPAWLRRLPALASGPLAHAFPTPLLRSAHRFLDRLGDTTEQRYAAWMLHFDLKRKRAICRESFLEAVTPDVVPAMEAVLARSTGPDLVDRLLDLDVRTYLLDDLLVKVDIATMAHSLEARSPLLDHRLMELAARLPSTFKIKDGRVKKHLLRRVAGKLLPAEILERPKMGFGVPLDRWFQDRLQGHAREILLDERTLSRGYFKPQEVRRILDEHASGRVFWHYQIWNLLMLEGWFRTFIDARPSLAPPG